MYDTLKSLANRPDPFCRYTASDLWTRPHIAQQMLAFHLDGSNDVASRSEDRISSIIDWMNRCFLLAGKKVCDLGCGPGLYASRLAQMGADVTGVDFSPVSFDHAKTHYGTHTNAPKFVLRDYLADPLPKDQDLYLLIYCDYCALSPIQRRSLLAKIKANLAEGGQIVFDVFSDRFYAKRDETLTLEDNLMGGFWSPSPYVGLMRTWLYGESHLSLDHYLISSQSEQFEILNWLQHFSPGSLRAELEAFGFCDISFVDFDHGQALTDDYGDEFGVIISI